MPGVTRRLDAAPKQVRPRLARARGRRAGAAGPPPDGPLLVVAAFAPELAPLRRALARPPAAGDADAVVCLPVGIGLVDAAAGVARALALARVAPRAIVLVGTAGSYGRAPAIGDVVVARHLLLASTAAIRGDGYLPTPLATHARADAKLGRALLGASPAGAAMLADVATPLAITHTAAAARRLAQVTGARVENLEAFAVARAAAAAGIPFCAVLGISNRVGPHAHEEWRLHRDRAAGAACAVVVALVRPASDEPTRLRGPSRARTDRGPRPR